MKIVFGLFIMCIVFTVITTENVCHENTINIEDIIISCLHGSLNDENYLSSVDMVFSANNFTSDLSKNQNILLLLENNNIRTLKVLPNLSKITSLSFKHNVITEVENGAFQNIFHLKSLDLSYNELSGETLTKDIFTSNRVSENYEPLPLENLNLGNNKIAFLKHDFFVHISDLKSLDLSNNPIDILELKKAFVHLKKLQVLNIAQSGLSFIPYSIFNSIPIQKLYINGNHFTHVPSSISKLSKTLWFLNLNDNPIEEINSDSFSQLSRLKELHIDGMNKLLMIDEDAFSPLAMLKILQCSFNPNLKFFHSKAFNKLKKRWTLEELYIHNNNLRYLSEDLAIWQKLNILDIRGNPWNCTCSLHWLFNFVKKRQMLNPEANIGIRCSYPTQLENSSFIDADNLMQCKDEKQNEKQEYNRHETKSIIHYFGYLIILSFILYFLIIKIQNRSNRKRLKSSIISTIKYERARIHELD